MILPTPVGSRFLRVLAAESVSQLGTGLHLVALPLLATTVSSDPRVIAALALAAGAPGLLLSLPIGVWVDRTHRGRLMAGSDLACFVLLAAVLTTWCVGPIHLATLFVLAAGLGVAELVFRTSAFALVPSLVDDGDLLRANGYLAGAGQIGAGIVGPAIGGLAFAATPLLPFIVNAASFLASALLIGSFAWSADTRSAPAPLVVPREPGRREFTAGLRYLRHHRLVRSTLVLTATAGLFGWMPEATLVLFAQQELGLGNAGFGLLLGATTVGAVIGGALAGRVSRRLGEAKVLAITYLSYGLLLIPVAFVTSAWLAGVLFFVQGLPLIVCDATLRSIQQRLVPDELRGRVGAVNRLVGSVVVPISLAAGGGLGAWLGLRPVWAIAGGGFVLAYLLNVPALRGAGRTDRNTAEAGT